MLLRMKRIVGWVAAACAALSTAQAISAQASAQNSGPATAPSIREAAVMHQATGTFDVKIAPQKPDNPQAEAAALGRMSIDKQFHGDLEATSQGEMLSVLDKAKGSGGYVALERVTGKLQGRSGSFVLQHNATMNRGVPELNIIVVPDSGTDELTGLSGSMKIRIESGQHFYDFEYSLDAAAH
jgi:hypothetical protein